MLQWLVVISGVSGRSLKSFLETIHDLEEARAL